MSNPSTVESLKHSWRNGGRLMVFTAGVLSVAVLFLLSASIYLLVRQSQQETPNPLQSPSPEQILDKRASYRVGDSITILGAKCNTSKKTVLIRGTSWWQNMESGADGSKIPSGGNSATGRALPPGCMPLAFPHVIPSTLTPGKWAFVGEDCTDSGQCTSWYSDNFILTGAP